MQICEALEEAHAAGVIHRDLKPANVVIETVDGDRPRAGARLRHGQALARRRSGEHRLTEQNMVFGTPEYMAPEQARGDDLDAGCDIYAAGVMLYELLTVASPSPRRAPWPS